MNASGNERKEEEEECEKRGMTKERNENERRGNLCCGEKEV